ncbi:MAG: hypothetical protein JNK05_24860 [Myxococcales bacterium]|nr:hypothetical protein [Myxococcales bacterium]
MSVLIYANKHFLCARWGTITRDDLEQLLTRAQAIQRSEGRRLVYAGVQYDDSSLPDRELTRHLIERATTLAKACDRFYLVIAARGVSASLHRTSVRSMLTVARIAGADVRRVQVMDSVDAVLADAGDDLPVARAVLRAELTAAGIP